MNHATVQQQQLPGEPAGAAPEPTAADRFAARRVSYGYLQRDLNAIPAGWRLVAVAIDGGAGVIVLERDPLDPALLRAELERLQRALAETEKAGDEIRRKNAALADRSAELLGERDQARAVMRESSDALVAIREALGVNPATSPGVVQAVRDLVCDRNDVREKWHSAEQEVEREHEAAVRAARELAEVKRDAPAQPRPACQSARVCICATAAPTTGWSPNCPVHGGGSTA